MRSLRQRGRPHLRATFTPLTLTYPSCDHPSTSPHPSLHLRLKPAETYRASILPFFLTWAGHHLGLGSPLSPRNSGLQCKAFSCWMIYGITTYPSFPIPVKPSSVAVVDCAQLREGCIAVGRLAACWIQNCKLKGRSSPWSFYP